MNKDKFENEMKSQLSSNSVDISFLSRWFDKTLEGLRSISEQRSDISHPRHRGDAREIDIQGILEKIFPDVLPLRKGFVLNNHTTVSREQDIIVTNGDTAGSLIQAGEVSYFPIESCLASIEVKSNLTLPEIRKSIISCISVKSYCMETPIPMIEKRNKKKIFATPYFPMVVQKTLRVQQRNLTLY